MKTARLYQQCWSDRDSRTGSFLYNPQTGEQPSPTFADTLDLFRWCTANGWRARDKTLNSPYVQETKDA